MASCKNCGAGIANGATTCPVCGAPVATVSEEQVAPFQIGGAPTPSVADAATGNVQAQLGASPTKKKKSPLKIVLIIVAALVILSMLSQCARSCTPKELEDWPTGPLAQMLPVMSVKCDMVSETSSSLSIRVSQGVDKGKYEAYVAECKERGFTIEAEESPDGYEAFNSDGYQLGLSYTDFSEPYISINLDAPKAIGDLAWPDYGLATLLPNPNKVKGEVANDSSSVFSAYIGDVSKDEYDTYVEACRQKGFTEDHSKYDDSYYAEDVRGNSLQVSFEGFNVMYVSVYAAHDAERGFANEQGSADVPASSEPEGGEQELEASPESETAEDQPSANAENGDFKKLMDDYEKFIDDYIAFMKKYQDEGAPASMLVDYGKMMADYGDWVAQIDAVDYDSLTAEEVDYANEVNLRVAQKLNDAALEMS